MAGEEWFAGLDLDDDRYTVDFSATGNTWETTNSAGEVVLRASQPAVQTRRYLEEFTYTDGDDAAVFRVVPHGESDRDRTALVDARTDEVVVLFGYDVGIAAERWEVYDRAERLLATFETWGRLRPALRTATPLGLVLDRRYEIADANGRVAGRIAGDLTSINRYHVEFDDPDAVPVEPVVAAATAIDFMD